MQTFYNFEIKNNKFSIDLSKISKIIFNQNKKLYNDNYRIFIFYFGNKSAELELELSNKSEAENLYNELQQKTNYYKEHILLNNNLIQLKKENEFLKEAFNKFKEFLTLIEDGK
jgi:hypothetical protein